MKFPVIRESYFLNIVILVCSVFISGFTLLFGIANLINPEVSEEYLFQNTIVCTILCVIGVVFLLIAFASIQGILYKIKNRSPVKN